jgi:UDP-MurNAc hydroxylase
MVVGIKHLQSSTQIIQLDSIKVLTDPWLTEGEYLGSWFHYPPFGETNISNLDYDYIYVSHVHPDHASESTFSKLPNKVPVLIHEFSSKFLKNKIESFGYEVYELRHGESFTFLNGASITIFAADNCDPELCLKFMGCAPTEDSYLSTQIDTLALFEYNGIRVLNTNDCPFELASKTMIANGLDRLKVDALLVGYAGAGPYPQCFEFDSYESLKRAAKEKETKFLDSASAFVKLVQPKVFIPFAGTYVLGTRLSSLNDVRGIPKIDRAIEYIEKKVEHASIGVYLKQNEVIDLENGTKLQSGVDSHISYEDYINVISKMKLDYDDDVWDETDLLTLIDASYKRFITKAKEINFKSATQIIVDTDRIGFSFSCENPPLVGHENVSTSQFVKLKLDHNLLHRLLRGPKYAHWNNAEIGSHIQYSRNPDVFERGLYHSLSFFHK